uniref:USP domain-containing protein n=1 Tax=Rhabditophanes sp. KR3021 TaxID=114890 RepID=A0AC35TGV2_9BILA
MATKRKHSGNGKSSDSKSVLSREVLKSIELSSEVTLPTALKLAELDKHDCAHSKMNCTKKANCKDSPYCLKNLGMEKMDKMQQKIVLEISNKDVEMRNINEKPSGLQNSGNHCYVNSFLQIWFNYLPFRKAVYDFEADENFEQPIDSKLNIQNTMLSLKDLFATMQITPFEDACALPLIKLLKLNNEQNDALEFTTLFFSMLERELKMHNNGNPLRNLVMTAMKSVQKQTLECTCGQKSVLSSDIGNIPLNVQNCKTLQEAIDSYFCREKVDDYNCEGCNRSGNVIKSIEINKLPKVLVIQLNRISYDSSGKSCKVNTPIHYPRRICSSKLNPNIAVRNEYELFGVMIHDGNQTYCGHYFDLIKDPNTGKWFKYNDRMVDETKAPGYDTEPNTSVKSSTDMKGCYALLYRAVTEFEEIPTPNKEMLAKLNKDLYEKFLISKEGTLSEKLWKNTFLEAYKRINQMWSNLLIEPSSTLPTKDDDIAFVSTKVLRQFHETFMSVYEKKVEIPSSFNINRESYNLDETQTFLKENLYPKPHFQTITLELCGHGKLLLESILSGDVKAVNKRGIVEMLDTMQLSVYNVESIKNSDQYFKRNIITINDICLSCIEKLKERMTFEKNLDSTNAVIKNILKDSARRTFDYKIWKEKNISFPEKARWVGKAHLKNYKKLAGDMINRYFRTFGTPHRLIFSSNSQDNNGTEDTDEEYDEVVEKKTKIENEFSEGFEELTTKTNRLSEDINEDFLFNDVLFCPHRGLTYEEPRLYVSYDEWQKITDPIFPENNEVICGEIDECSDCTTKYFVNENDRTLRAQKVNGLKEEIGPLIKGIEKRQATSTNVKFSHVLCKRFIRNFPKVFKSEEYTKQLNGVCQECLVCDKHKKQFLQEDLKQYNELFVSVSEDEFNKIGLAVLNHGFIEKMPLELKIDVETGFPNDESFCEECHEQALKDQDDDRFFYPNGAKIYAKVVDLNEKNSENGFNLFLTTKRNNTKNVISCNMYSTEKVFEMKAAFANLLKVNPYSLTILNNEKELNNDLTLQESKIPKGNDDNPMVLIVNQNETSYCIDERPVETGFKDSALS